MTRPLTLTGLFVAVPGLSNSTAPGQKTALHPSRRAAAPIRIPDRGEGLSTGIFFVHTAAGDFTATRNHILIK